jgi:diamine N-acetyltransferase
VIHLGEIDGNNWREPLAVREDQMRFVSPPFRLLARAYAYRNARSRALMIYADETPVWMLLYYDCDDANAFAFSQLFIDRRYQGQGYGREAAKEAIVLMKRDGKYNRIVTCYVEGNDAAKDLYLKLGFKHTGEKDGDEFVMSLEW